ncbi:Putative Threonyl-tRNA synthetase [Lichtheimia ramosa]|uniref:Threonine--tRNA ligase, cytoplasmic n=1 Tax=Lichtheimia ramosa TaxID=688394 RepID=A0A077WLM6_9FUNG|nr:Putative Threonyl-tRNA synthetase [Lichtheimia ramosa]
MSEVKPAPAPAAAPVKKEKKDKKASKKPAATEAQYPLEMTPAPEYLQYRIDMFDRLKAEADAALKDKPRVPITITLPDGTKKEGTSYETSPMDIALGISKSLADRTVIAKVNGELWDLERPFEESSSLELLDFESEDGKKVFWHSSAHMLGEACERHYGCHLCIGPPLEDGFYYEMGLKDRVVSQADYANLEKLVGIINKEKQPFERLVVSKENLLEMFKHNPYKQHIINDKIPDGTSTTVYRCGPLIDLCRGPHVPHTGRIKTFTITKNSASYFLGDAKNDSLQRIYGISFPDKKQMSEYKKFIEEASKRDHRKIGKEQELFFFHELSPGSAFFLPHGARIYNALMDLIRNEYQQRGFTEVITPNMFNLKLWNQSGHAAKYKENMFCLEVDKEEFALKPMNCPGHCLMFGHTEHSYRELPIRYADFGVLHRNEFSGALSGLTRVRRFQQDDAHIFCRQDQIEQEMANCFDFLNHVYGIFGFEFHLKLSTRPENFIGEVEVWNNAEKKLEDALNKFAEKKGISWELNPGDGAFYGPKIDIVISDALRRKHQCATIQLDFQLPERFQLHYRTQNSSQEETFARPVIIHRAILGSVERMMGILIEHFGGKFPFWLSPRQVSVIPVAAPFIPYAKQVTEKLVAAGIYADADLSDITLNKKIRNSEIAQYNFIFVVGGEEESTQSVNVRNRDDVGTKAKGKTIPLDDVLASAIRLKESKSLENKF